MIFKFYKVWIYVRCFDQQSRKKGEERSKSFSVHKCNITPSKQTKRDEDSVFEFLRPAKNRDEKRNDRTRGIKSIGVSSGNMARLDTHCKH